MNHNKYERRGEDHATRDTKTTATDRALEKYHNLAEEESIEKARAMAVLDMRHNERDEQRVRHIAARNDREIAQDEIYDGIEDYFAEKKSAESIAVSIESFEHDAVDIPVSHRLGSLATRR